MTDPEMQRYVLQRALGDLGPARRHIERLEAQALAPSPAVIREIGAAIERCVRRLEALLNGETHAE